MYEKICQELDEMIDEKGDFPYLIKDSLSRVDSLNKVQVKRAKDLAQIWLKDLRKIQNENETKLLSIQKKINLAKKILNLV